MSVELYDEKGTRTKLARDEPLWRGVTMLDVQERPLAAPGTDDNARSFPDRLRWADANPRDMIRQQIKLESNDSHVLFGFRPILDAAVHGAERARAQPGRRDDLPPRRPLRLVRLRGATPAPTSTGPQPGESTPGPRTSGRACRAVPETLTAQLREIAQPIVEADSRPSDRRRPCQALESYLRDSGEFGYTLQHRTSVDPKLDPVVDFLVNRKEGHCEYFASAPDAAAPLDRHPRADGQRLQGGRLERASAGCMNVRQKHAHSWVEAYLGRRARRRHRRSGSPSTRPHASERDHSVGRVGGFRGNFRQLTDLVRYVWVFYIVGYNAERQNRFIYEPIRRLANEAARASGSWARRSQEVASRPAPVPEDRVV